MKTQVVTKGYFDKKLNQLAGMINDGFVEAKKERESIRKEAERARNKIQKQLDRFLVVEFDHAKGQIKDLQSRVDSIEKTLALR